MKRLIAMLVLGLVLLLALAAPTLGKKGGKVTFNVSLEVQDEAVTCDDYQTVTCDDCAQWPTLAPNFWVTDPRSYQGKDIEMGSVELDLFGMSPQRKRGDIVAVMLFFHGNDENDYQTDEIPVSGEGEVTQNTSFTIEVNATGEVWRYGPKGKRVEPIGTVCVGDAVYTPTAP